MTNPVDVYGIRRAIDRKDRIVRAAERLIAHWKSMGYPGAGWQHRGHWYPMCSEKQCKALINAVLRKPRANRPSNSA